jgi:hypothetical protein
MNKGNKAAPKKTVSVAASAPLLPHGEQYTQAPTHGRHDSISSKCFSSILAVRIQTMHMLFWKT